ncbi:FKBP-type peptidyl-prolyl cis-trans isomerase [Candidatus Microgenomates bacterium]|nr:FKBP-type peptidyl-prolyl cis-trans isomerase [Candidatus Microgenomates bacterium]
MSRGKIIFGGVVLVIILVVGAGFWGRKMDEKKSPPPAETSTPISNMPITQSLISEELVTGTGDVATAGATLTVNYRGTLLDGTEFDSSYKRNQPFKFVLGAGEVIAGWDKGFAGMKVGGKRKLTIPPEMGYGSRSAGSIPPNSTLIFEVELLAVSR